MSEPIWVELPVLWDKEGQPDYEELGVDGLDIPIETSESMLYIDLNDVISFHDAGKYPGSTWMHTNGASYVVKMKPEEFKDYYSSMTGRTMLTMQDYAEKKSSISVS